MGLRGTLLYVFATAVVTMDVVLIRWTGSVDVWNGECAPDGTGAAEMRVPVHGYDTGSVSAPGGREEGGE